MTNYEITFHISRIVYERAQRIATQSSQLVKQVLEARLDSAFDELSPLPASEQAELTALRQLADDTLFSMAAEQMPAALNERMVMLGERTSLGQIAPPEATEYAALVERGNRLMLRKAWAANILMDRGYTLSQDDFAPHRE